MKHDGGGGLVVGLVVEVVVVVDVVEVVHMGQDVEAWVVRGASTHSLRLCD